MITVKRNGLYRVHRMVTLPLDRLIAPVAPGYYLAESVAKCLILWCSIELITVTDIDGKGDCPRGALGYQPTPRGLHLYLPPGQHSTAQDAVYYHLSRWRRAWCERLYDRDGVTPRPVPIALRNDGAMSRHIAAFKLAQSMSIKLNIQRGVAAQS